MNDAQIEINATPAEPQPAITVTDTPIELSPLANKMCAECGSKPARFRARFMDVCSRKCFDTFWRRDFLRRLQQGKPPVLDKVRPEMKSQLEAAIEKASVVPESAATTSSGTTEGGPAPGEAEQHKTPSEGTA